MKFKQFLEEGRDAHLYHATNMSALVSMLKEDKISGHTIHSARGIRPNLKHKHQRQHDNGVSLTRYFEYAMTWGPVVLVLDQRKLAQKHKIVPVDWYYDTSDHSVMYREEAEEFVIGDIKNLKRYLLGIQILFIIEVDSESLKRSLESIKQYGFLDLVNNDTLPRRFRNKRKKIEFP